ncbi:MAG: DNA repair protein RecO [Planctomycetota bacterium]|nr:DNA repair protein RecO [Planctomycetota bacterium]
MKGVFRTRGLVLRCTDYSETSQIVRVFTRDHGVIDLLAKGSRRPVRASSSFPAPFDLAGWYDLNFRSRSTELHLATESRLVEGFDHLRQDISVWLDATFALDLMRNLFSPGDPHPGLLKEALQYLKLLEHGVGRRRLRNRLMQALLSASGVLPDWTRCIECEGQVTGRSGLHVPAGLICAECSILGSCESLELSTSRYLASDSTRDWGLVPSWEVPAEQVQAGWNLLRSLLLHHLERPPRSLRYLRV